MVDAGKVSLGVYLAGFVLLILSISTRYWMALYTRVLDVTSGVWVYCTRAADATSWDCGRIDQPDSKQEAVQAMMSLAMIFCWVSLVFFILWLRNRDNSKYCMGALGTCLAAGLFGLFGVSIFASQFDTSSLSWSFGLGCCSAVLLIIDGAFFLTMILLKREGYQRIDV